MTTDQTIDGVPRRVCHACVTLPRNAYCPVCDDEPSAQHQGEPVAYEKPHYDNHYGYTGGYVDWGFPRDVRAVLDHVESVLDEVPEGPLYADQPAPVAGDLSIDETEFLKTVAASPGCKLSGYDDEGNPLWRRLVDLGLIVATGGHKWKTTFDVFELGISAALGQRLQTVAVVMRCSFCDVVNEHGSPWSCHSESVDGNLVYRVIGCKDHKHLVDALIGELKRLNDINK